MASDHGEFEGMPLRCQDEGHEFLCRMAEGSCANCIPQQPQSQQALADQFAVGHQAVTRLGLYDLADWMRTAFFARTVPCSECRGYGFHGHTSPEYGIECEACGGAGSTSQTARSTGVAS